MDFADLSNLIRARRSIRRWEERKVPEELLLQAVELATWAPNGGNQQGWRFYIIMNNDIIRAIAGAVQASADLITSWPEAAKFGTDAARWREGASSFGTAPAAIAVAAARYRSLADSILTARAEVDHQAAQMREWRNTSSTRIQSVASAIAYLLLVLHQMGLGALWMTGPMQAKGEIERILRVPPEMDLMAFIPIGYPAESPHNQGRRPVTEVTEIIS